MEKLFTITSNVNVLPCEFLVVIQHYRQPQIVVISRLWKSYWLQDPTLMFYLLINKFDHTAWVMSTKLVPSLGRGTDSGLAFHIDPSLSAPDPLLSARHGSTSTLIYSRASH